MSEFAARVGELESHRDRPIVVHCQAGTRASIAASLLARQGFTDVTVFSGGVDGWKKAGLPLVREQE